MAPAPLSIGAASRTYPGEDVNGDSWQVDWLDHGCRIAVIDGLGHGPQAAAAADAARATLTGLRDLSPVAALHACHGALAGTRGAAISIAAVDGDGSRLVYAGVGNVDGHLWHAGRQQRLVAYRGIVGKAVPTVRAFTFSLPPEWTLLIHTDGVSTRFRLDALPAEVMAQAQPLAERVLQDWGRSTDDATVVVVCPAQ